MNTRARRCPPAASKNACPPAICQAQGSCHPKPAAGDVSIYLT
ncbi:hypothetical protein PFWH6_5764 [Pseudomonas fluorescens WH6]|nr:hypothetical protein PFWH6_5764 [Pseudomonas fluorescens WH6]